MEFAIADKFNNVLFEGISDNPYHVRNVMLRYIPQEPRESDYETPHFLHIPSGLVLIWCSAELPSLLKPTPLVLNDSAKQPLMSYQGSVTLASLCAKYKLDPIRSRKLLRREYGAQGRKYCFNISEIVDVLAIIN